MRLYINNNTFHYELENLCRIFFPNDKIEVVKDAVPQIEETDFVLIQLDDLLDDIKITVKVSFSDFSKVSEKQFSNNTGLDDLERETAVMLFDILTEYTQVIPPWGILTGVRPIKLARRMIDTYGKEFTESYFKDKLKVSQDKVRLAMITEANERKILELSRKESYSLYVSIPFCPTRCSYCSFVSQSIEKAKRLIEPYVEKLCEELKETAKIMSGLNLRLETVYIGGGTPTTL
ncbi:MAG: radical SAM protein, partial [Acutalibacteraceae bacterium]